MKVSKQRQAKKPQLDPRFELNYLAPYVSDIEFIGYK